MKKAFVFILLIVLSFASNAQGFKVNNFKKNPKDCELSDTIYYYFSSQQVVKVVYQKRGWFREFVYSKSASSNYQIRSRGGAFYHTYYTDSTEMDGVEIEVRNRRIESIYRVQNKKKHGWCYYFIKGRFVELAEYDQGWKTYRLLCINRRGKIWMDTDHLASGWWLNVLN